MAVRKTHAVGKKKAKARVKAKKMVKAAIPVRKQGKAAGVNRAEGIRLFKIAGRPTKEQFVLVYGERGPRMTWGQRAAAGVPAKKFQAALAAKQAGR